MFYLMKLVNAILRRLLGYEMIPSQYLSEIKNKIIQYENDELVSKADFSDFEKEMVLYSKSYSMTGPERIVSLVNAIRYICENNVTGSIVECGVWRGGSMMVAAKTLTHLNSTDRSLYLYDTFEGMSTPTDADLSFDGQLAEEQLKQKRYDREKGDNIWCYSALEEVQKNLHSTNYLKEKIYFIKGKVEDTIPHTLPGKISLLRLDTDWYESTYHELKHLFPLLEKGGIIIIDDYGHWQGAKKATDDYFKENNIKLFLNRIDYTGRIGVKI